MRILNIILVLFLFSLTTTATIRYVSKSGSSTPPFTSWETASDSIQKCINVCFAGDTIVVSNGLYKETFKVTIPLTLIGSGADSCIIDATGIGSYFSIRVEESFRIRGFTFKKDGSSASIFSIYSLQNFIEDCIFESTSLPSIGGMVSSISIKNCIFRNCTGNVYLTLLSPLKTGIIENCISISGKDYFSDFRLEFGHQTIRNNIIIHNSSTVDANIGIFSDMPSTVYIHNNLVAGSIEGIVLTGGYSFIDSGLICNNLVGYKKYDPNFYWAGILGNANIKMINNIVYNHNTGLYIPTGVTPPITYEGGYNMLWNNVNDTYNCQLKETDMVADPMFVNDTVPSWNMSYDFHLQKYSPGIDSGDPSILDIDGTRSDIGLYGGPYGEEYKYVDIAPRKPYGIVPSINGKDIAIKWRKNSESDTSHYIIYRDTLADFTPDSVLICKIQKDTLFTDVFPEGLAKVYYRIQCVDKQGNKGDASDVISFVLSDGGEYKSEDNYDYHLYQNYPNPFNPLTKIGYQLKERGKVKIMVYDIKGELIRQVLNEEKEAGYYEAEFDGSVLSSGIYLCRIEIINGKGIPVYMNMRKMVLIK